MPELTDADRDAINRARELSEYVPMDVIRERTGEINTERALITELSRVRELLAELAGRLERSGGS